MKPIVIVDMSKIYAQETFWKEKNVQWISASDITGTNCYCDDEAKEYLGNILTKEYLEGIHFIDSGNYHYLSAIWLKNLERPFRLIVFDNHTDMQLPAFGGILSCGGWIGDVIENNPYMQEVYLVGPDQEAYNQVEERFKERCKFYSRECLAQKKKIEIDQFICDIKTDLPIYISIDKDILCQEDAATAWSQGDMTLEDLKSILNAIVEHIKEKNGTILALDICGECSPEMEEKNDINDNANGELLNFYQSVIEEV